MRVPRDLFMLTLLAKVLVLLRQILFKLANIAIAEAILMWISAEQVAFCTGLLLGT